MKLKTLTLCTLLSASVAVAFQAQASSDTYEAVDVQQNKQEKNVPNLQSQADSLDTQHQSFKQSADLIRTTYESQLFTLPAFKEGHYGLRMYRQTLDDKYAAAVWSDMARVASKLSSLSNDVHTMEQIVLYSEKRVASYVGDDDERSVRRYNITKHMPEYLYLGVDLLGSMARASEYGLEHKNDAKLREIIRRYDFSRYVTNEDMVKAWAAQLANQVYWLRQLGEQDVVDEFVDTFKKRIPTTRTRSFQANNTVIRSMA